MKNETLAVSDLLNEPDGQIKVSELSELAERLDNLERDNQHWKTGAIVLAMILISSVLWTYFGSNSTRILEARQVLLKDAQGAVRGELGVDRYGKPRLRLLDQEGNETVRLESTDSASQLQMFDRGRLRIDMAAMHQGAVLNLMDEHSSPASTLYLNDRNGAGLKLRGAQGESHIKNDLHPGDSLSPNSPTLVPFTSFEDRTAE